jgi:phenylpropionate dioxygenase-like ring-hydroxylating dioxygenase large terminal subunit
MTGGTVNPAIDEGATADAPRPQPLPAEGEGGLFSESWFPVCLSTDVKTGQVIGRDFLDGRVAIYRDSGGTAHVMSAYCPHLGADLAVGAVVGDRLRCAFHHWEYDGTGACTRTGTGDKGPRAARLFRFPVRERWGVVFAFNGLEPGWELPDFAYPDDELHTTVRTFPELRCDPWVICCNTPDVQHIKVLHRIRLDDEGPSTGAWTGHSMSYGFKGWHSDGNPVDWEVAIYGTSLFIQQGRFNGTWLGVTTPMGLPRPGTTDVYMITVAHIGDGSERARTAAAAAAEQFARMEAAVFFEDAPVLQTMRFRPQVLTRDDRRLAQFFEYLRKFPRSHHSAPYIT